MAPRAQHQVSAVDSEENCVQCGTYTRHVHSPEGAYNLYLDCALPSRRVKARRRARLLKSYLIVKCARFVTPGDQEHSTKITMFTTPESRSAEPDSSGTQGSRDLSSLHCLRVERLD